LKDRQARRRHQQGDHANVNRLAALRRQPNRVVPIPDHAFGCHANRCQARRACLAEDRLEIEALTSCARKRFWLPRSTQRN
jgi:hypothetical protein